jgi:hypothetical protein
VLLVHPLARLAVALVVLSTASAARAAPPQVPMSLDCAALDDEGRAALEARARADLVLEPYREGSLSISCRGDSSRVVWSPAGGQVRTRLRELPADRRAIVDGLLEDMHAVLSEASLETEQPAPPASGPVIGSAAPSTPAQETPPVETPPVEAPQPTAAVLGLAASRDAAAAGTTDARVVQAARGGYRSPEGLAGGRRARADCRRGRSRLH